MIPGPCTSNFTETFPPLIAAGGAVEVQDAPGLAHAVQHWLEEPEALHAACAAASGFARSQAQELDGVADLLIDRLGLGAKGTHPDA